MAVQDRSRTIVWSSLTVLGGGAVLVTGLEVSGHAMIAVAVAALGFTGAVVFAAVLLGRAVRRNRTVMQQNTRAMAHLTEQVRRSASPRHARS